MTTPPHFCVSTFDHSVRTLGIKSLLMRAHPARSQQTTTACDRVATVGGAWKVLDHTFLQARGTIAISTYTTLMACYAD